jgi:hypothetical protein
LERLDDNVAGTWVKALVYGDSGSGKTTLGVTAPRPLILLSERQGLLSVRQAAKRLGVPVPTVLFCTQLDDYRRVVRALVSSKQKPFRVLDSNRKDVCLELAEWPETVVVDSITDVCRIVSEEIREQSPPKMGKDGLPVDSERYWNVFGDRMTSIIAAFRDAPVNVLFLALKDDRETGEDAAKVRAVTPAMAMRKLPAALSAACNLTGYAYRREVRKGKAVQVVHGVMTVGPEYMMLKPCQGIRPVEVPDFTYWVRAINGWLDQGETPEAPATSSESMAGGVAEADQPVKAEEPAEPPRRAATVDDHVGGLTPAEHDAAREQHTGEPPRPAGNAAPLALGEAELAAKLEALKLEQAKAAANHHHDPKEREYREAERAAIEGEAKAGEVSVPAGGSDSVQPAAAPAEDQSKTGGQTRRRRRSSASA